MAIKVTNGKCLGYDFRNNKKTESAVLKVTRQNSLPYDPVVTGMKFTFYFPFLIGGGGNHHPFIIFAPDNYDIPHQIALCVPAESIRGR